MGSVTVRLIGELEGGLSSTSINEMILRQLAATADSNTAECTG